MMLLRKLITYIATFVTLGGGILATIFLVVRLHAPGLVLPGVIAILAATAVVGLATAPGRTLEDRYRWLSGALEGSGREGS